MRSRWPDRNKPPDPSPSFPACDMISEMVIARNFAPHFWCFSTTSNSCLHFQLNILKISLKPVAKSALTFLHLSVWCVCVDVCFSVRIYVRVFQVTFSDAMRSKARLSITGSTGENGRVMSPEFPKAVHAVPFVRPGVGMNVSLTDLSWWIRTCRVALHNGFQ